MIVDKSTKIYVGDTKIKKVKQGEEQIFPLGSIYGIRRQLSSSSPTWERIEDSVGLMANATHDGSPVRNDFDELYPWSDIISYNYDVANDNITAYYGDNNFQFDGSNGQVLTKIPEFWWKRYQDNDWEYIYISTSEEEGFNYSPEFSIARFLMGSQNNQARSISGIIPTYCNISSARSMVQAVSSKLCLLDYHYFLILLLYLVEYANYDCQSILGLGCCSNSSPSTGGCNSLGMKSGCLYNDGYHSVVYRGMEDLYSYYFQTLDGMITKDNYVISISCNPNDYGDHGKYQPLSVQYCYGVWSPITQLTYDPNYPMVQLPKTNSGGSFTTYMCDANYSFNGGSRVVQVGGSRYYNNYNGLWCVAMANSFGSSFNDMGYRFIKYK